MNPLLVDFTVDRHLPRCVSAAMPCPPGIVAAASRAETNHQLGAPPPEPTLPPLVGGGSFVTVSVALVLVTLPSELVATTVLSPASEARTSVKLQARRHSRCKIARIKNEGFVGALAQLEKTSATHNGLEHQPLCSNPAATGQTHLYTEFTKPDDLRKRGIITEEEFFAQKKRLLEKQ